MTVRFENIFEVCIYNPDGFTEQNYFQVRDEVDASKPDYWRLFQPSTVLSFFLERKNGKNRSEELISRIHDLKRTSPIFAVVGVGVSENKYIVEMDDFSRIKGMPIGNRGEAYKNAKNDSSSGVAG